MKQKRFSGMVLWLSFTLIICMASGNTLLDAKSMTIAENQQSGTVRNASNAQIGKIESNGRVRNVSNAQIGSAPGVKTEWVAAFFFFDFFTK